MFKLNPDPTFWMTAVIPDPGTDGVPLTVQCRRWTRDEINSVEAKYELLDDLLGDVIVGWKNVDAEFSRENLMQLLQRYPGAAQALGGKWKLEHSDAKRKN